MRSQQDGKTVILPEYRSAPLDFPQERWDEIFPGKKEFEAKYGKIIKAKITSRREGYEYIDGNGHIKTIEFIR